MPSYSYVRNVTAETNGTLRVATEAIQSYLLATKGGTFYAPLEGETTEAALARGAAEGVSFMYKPSEFKIWWAELSEDTKAKWTEEMPVGFFVQEEGVEVIYSLETGEPATQAELEAAGAVLEVGDDVVEEHDKAVEAELVDEPAEDTDPTKSNDETVAAQDDTDVPGDVVQGDTVDSEEVGA